MVTHNNLIEITNNLDDSVKEKDMYIAIPSKEGYMLHEVTNAEIVTMDGDISGDHGVLIISPIAAYCLDAGMKDKLDKDQVPYIKYDFMNIEELAKETEEKVSTPNE